MAKSNELQAQIDQAVRQALRQAGYLPPEPVTTDVTQRADFIPHGSAAHAVFLGLVEVKEGDDVTGRNTLKSPRTGRTWMLEDEITGFIHYPDPKQAAGLVLRQKVNELEQPPEVPIGSPPLWQPRE